MNKKINLIQKFLIKNNFSFYFVTNSDIHLNESPNLKQKDIFNLTGFDCSNGYLIILRKNILFFTDSRYTLAASNFFKKKCEVFDLKNQSIPDYLKTIFSDIKGLIDPKLVSIREIINLRNILDKSSIKIIPNYRHIFSKNYFPNFDISYPFSLPKYCVPRKYTDNIRWIRLSCGCGDRCPVWVQLGLGLSVVSWGLGSTGDWGACPMRPGDHLHPE